MMTQCSVAARILLAIALFRHLSLILSIPYPAHFSSSNSRQLVLNRGSIEVEIYSN